MTMQILENRRRPDALVCADNYIAYGCVNALHDRGILIPEEMKVITFDDFPFSQILKPMLCREHRCLRYGGAGREIYFAED